MRVVAITAAVALLLGFSVWLTTGDLIGPAPGRGRVGQDVSAVVVPKEGPASVATLSAPTTTLPDKPTAPATVPPDQATALTTAPPDKPTASTFPPAIAVRKWLVGELAHEGLSEFDSKRIVRATYDKIYRCYTAYGRGRSPNRPALLTCDENAIQESGMSEAFRRLEAKIKAADPGTSKVVLPF